MAKQTKKLSDVTTVNTVTTSQKIPLTDASGNVTTISLADLKAALLGGTNLNSMADGVFIMFHRANDNCPLMVKPHKWPSYQTSGEIAEGVVIAEGGKILVVAPTESALTWSSAAVTGGVSTTNRLAALDDWEGRANTTAQAAKPECSSESYAPGFCNAYSKTNANGNGLTAGKWWLPSLGEMMCIYANMTKVNYALSLISGATQLAETAYWTSTEYSATTAWGLHLSDGAAYGNPKATGQNRVRPVSAFLQ